MAGFKTHVTVSSLLGCGYAGAGYFYGMPLDTAILGGALCGFSGMLPDLDSDYGVPLRETMCFAAAVVPMLLLNRFASFGLRHDQMALLGVGLYLFMRFGVTNMIRKYTVHRGMFHSIPAGLVFAGLAFMICGSVDLPIRYYKAGGVLAGFMSHLVLDEMYSVEWTGGRWRLKKSAGTALKLWGDNAWANFSTYAKLAIVAAMILGEPTVIEQLENRNPEFARTYQQLHEQFQEQFQDRYRNWSDKLTSPVTNDAAPVDANRSVNPLAPQPGAFAPRSYQSAAPTVDHRFNLPPSPLPVTGDRNGWDTAQRPTSQYSQ